MQATVMRPDPRAQLEREGYAYLNSDGHPQVEELLVRLGPVLDETDVKPDLTSRSLLKSTKGLDFHTDHHRARFILWRCVRQSARGGETRLVDAGKAYHALGADERAALRRVRLTEHKVFPDDPESYPLVEGPEASPQFYFSFWFAKETLTGPNGSSVQSFMDAVARERPITITMREGDVLVIDNRRMLHSRGSFEGTERHLRRYWIGEPAVAPKTREKTPQAGLLVRPAISRARVEQLEQGRIDPDIAAIDLEMVKMKLAEPAEEIGWTVEQCEDAEIEYKRYLTLCRKFPYPDHSIVPNKIMDTMWHYHILDTRAYIRDCDRVFGHYMHHFPYFGLRGEDDSKKLRSAFETTKELYEQTFGEPMARNPESSCWHDCENRCWHACSDE